MEPVKLRAYPRDLHRLRELAATLTRLRWPFVGGEESYVDRAGTHGAGGTLLYSFKAHHEDAEALHEVAKQYISQNGVDIEAARQRIFGQVQQQAEDDVEEPAWRP